MREGVSHTATLLERHHITIPVGATNDNVAVARLHAEAWARAHGFDIAAGSFQVLQTRGARPGPVSQYVGVAFDVVVGKGDICLDQREPGSRDTWTWSQGHAERVWRLLNGVVAKAGARVIRPRADGLASVTELPGASFGNPLRHPSAEWLGGGALRGEGISPGPIPGAGPQSGTGQLPPWFRRGTDEDPDAT
ncbi:hypothetical protein I5G63_gp069 [Mycobacterium phage Imvubu]|uniref:Uncharacterized protein n=1 Tax=Mycobacterium phage Imvubu TaxID=2686233 RepID=A0A6B9L865_9CAUD|nr:hypothetical protein I5G63_gp069 [Mycobacterium phage Imvubu]QHB37810.1 hypothetical protein PBI_IMVUBU_69 [Mycobacterium phage Imvubu]